VAEKERSGADTPSIAQVADAMFAVLIEYHGRKRFTAGDLQKEMQARFGTGGSDRALCKAAIKALMDEDRAVYGYAGGSWIEPVVDR
jgi:hypothetical protein